MFPRQWYLTQHRSESWRAGDRLERPRSLAGLLGSGRDRWHLRRRVQYDHPDLDGNYDASLHITIGGTLHDPYPEGSFAGHGTNTAGIIASEADGRGTVGIAYGATIAAVDIFFDPVIGTVEFTPNWAAAFQPMRSFDITHHSWSFSPYIDGLITTSPSLLAFHAAWRGSVEFGRGGLGTVNVNSAGNSREFLEHTNQSNMTSSPYVIAVAAVNHDGEVTLYSNPGSSLLVSGLSNVVDGPLEGDIWTTDLTGAGGESDGSNQAPLNPDPDYDAFFGGTSASGPTVSGVIALMLEANPEAGYRDVQEIIAYSARHVGSDIGRRPSGNELHAWQFNAASDWNGGGLHFSNDYGFGLVDALAAVRMAETWISQKTFASLQRVFADDWAGNLVVPDGKTKGVSFSFVADAAIDLETVGLGLAHTGNLADYRITVTSPDGTTSVLTTPSRHLAVAQPWIYTSNEFRGEVGEGVWRVHVSDPLPGLKGSITAASLQFYGETEFRRRRPGLHQRVLGL